MIPRRNIIRNLQKALFEPAYACKAFYRRFKSYLAYNFYSGKSTLPESLTLFLTYKCNLRCQMCGQWGEMGSSKKYSSQVIKEELSIELLEKLLNDVSGFKPNITLFGGEPLLYSEVEKLIIGIKKRNLHCCIITNGTMISKYAQVFVENQLDELSISIDGPEKIHDVVRGVNGTFSRISEGMDKLNKLKIQNKSKFPIINIVCVISNANIKYLDEMIDVAEKFKAHTLNFHHLIFTDENTVKKHNEMFQKCFGASSLDWSGFAFKSLTEINAKELLEKINLINSRKKKVVVNFYPNFTGDEIKEYYANPDFISKGYSKKCMSPWVTAYIYPNGEVWPCLTLGYSVGNIQQNKFTDIWNSKDFIAFRRTLKKECMFPICPKCTEFYRY
ncbi:MAG: radical SAM protein [Candidatus Firestonebacteria bacterium]